MNKKQQKSAPTGREGKGMNRPRYTASIEEVESRPGCWNTLDVTVMENDKPIGKYKRNYSSMMNTFVPFVVGDQWYALYSEDYTATSVMRLPSCEKIAGEERSAAGFCPVDFYVPDDPEEVGICEGDDESWLGKIGFVAGCVWGDDSSWKIQILDLSGIEQGILKRDSETLGYMEIDTPLRESVRIYNYPWVEFKTYQTINLKTKKACL